MHPKRRSQLNDLTTPPFSPRAPDPGKSTTHLLDSLMAFYRQEIMWVYRTRAALELADPPTSDTLNDDAAHSPLPDTSSSTIAVDEEVIKKEPPATTTTTSLSRWDRRKHKFKLKLEGLPALRRTRQPEAPVYSVSESGIRVLELFESMMEARMESCERVNRLVRKANRANLYVR